MYPKEITNLKLGNHQPLGTKDLNTLQAWRREVVSLMVSKKTTKIFIHSIMPSTKTYNPYISSQTHENSKKSTQKLLNY